MQWKRDCSLISNRPVAIEMSFHLFVSAPYVSENILLVQQKQQDHTW